MLVSVRDPAEAETARRSGADVIDVKEPARGPLGAADARVASGIVRAVGRHRPVTAAAGDLGEIPPHALAAFAAETGVSIIKLGVRQPISAALLAEFCVLRDKLPRATSAAPTLYADAIDASSLNLRTLQHLRQATGCGWVVVDTWDKNSGGLLHAWRQEQVARFVRTAREAGLNTALAGGISFDSLEAVLATAPDLIGLRGALCDGGRSGRLSARLIRAAKQAFPAGDSRKNLTRPVESPYSVS
ncbi:MAG: hypothetical protein KDA37_15695 [Planctomycetales bacterium]|nr:hypothetical protein [Planctomycetales bacterium]